MHVNIIHCNNMRYLTLQSVVFGLKKTVHRLNSGSRGSKSEDRYQVIYLVRVDICPTNFQRQESMANLTK